MLLALGWNNERIAAALVVDKKTLTKHYFPELNQRLVARDRLDARLALNLWKQVEAGNVGAMREFQKLLERNDLMGADRDLKNGERQPDEVDEPRAPKLGKKEAADLIAQTAGEGSEWEGDLLPKAPRSH